MHAQPGEPRQTTGHGLSGGQLCHGRAVTDLSHRALVEVLERLRRVALDQPLDRYTDVVAGLERGGTEAGERLAGFTIRYDGDVADGEDARTIFHLKIGTDRNTLTVRQGHPQRVH